MIINKFDLRLFEGGAAGAGASGAAGAATGSADGGAASEATTGTESETIVYKPKNKKGKGELDNVVYGTQDDSVAQSQKTTSEEQQTVAEEKSPEQMFEEMIKGDYKQQYQDSVQKIINKRFKETKGLEAQIGAYAPLMEMLSQKYGTDPTDIDALTSAIENDDSIWEQQAYENDMDVEQYKTFRKLEMENQALMREQETRRGQEEAMRRMEDWNRQAAELQKSFPNFDLNAEAQNPEFLSLLKNGVPVDHAFKIIHLDDILNTQAESVAKQAEKNVVSSIRAKGSRPSENGTVSQAGFTYKSDVRNLSKKDRAEIAKRVQRGETITFR